jgi:hypothetical protein
MPSAHADVEQQPVATCLDQRVAEDQMRMCLFLVACGWTPRHRHRQALSATCRKRQDACRVPPQWLAYRRMIGQFGSQPDTAAQALLTLALSLALSHRDSSSAGWADSNDAASATIVSQPGCSPARDRAVSIRVQNPSVSTGRSISWPPSVRTSTPCTIRSMPPAAATSQVSPPTFAAAPRSALLMLAASQRARRLALSPISFPPAAPAWFIRRSRCCARWLG